MAITYSIGSQEEYFEPTSVSKTTRPLYSQNLKVIRKVIPLYTQSRVSKTTRPLYSQNVTISKRTRYVYSQSALDTLQILGVEL